jgi:hypothetical protein
MMPTVTIIPSTPEHVRLLGRSMREADAREITCLGLLPHRALWRSYRAALLRKTAFVDGEIAAMWGTGGCVLGRTGRPWLLTGPACEKVTPLTFARIYRREVEGMLKLFPILVNYVHAEYSGAMRLLRLTGFTLHEPEPIGPGGALFRKFEMRA